MLQLLRSRKTRNLQPPNHVLITFRIGIAVEYVSHRRFKSDVDLAVDEYANVVCCGVGGVRWKT